MKNLSAHIDEEMSALKKEFKTLHRHGGTTGSSSSSPPISADFSVLQATMSKNSERMEHLLHTRLNNPSSDEVQLDFYGEKIDGYLDYLAAHSSSSSSILLMDFFDDGQTFIAKVVSTHLLLVSTQCFKAKAECCRNGEVVSTLDQVDTLRKLCDLKSLLDTWHSRDLVDRPWIICPRPPRVLLDILGINTLLIGHPTTRGPPRAFQKSFWRQREPSSLFLLPLCSFTPIHTSSSTRREV
ncbi:hypothetical protein Taro_016522 [Colocasia esculenta]|uniref:Uncharacterized protein n=1 Tax=Colocasia esculenta TaxID=4460 RepID=A0A843UE08_COLES|nr:hypothetical protein [Colocasia esculenta]